MLNCVYIHDSTGTTVEFIATAASSCLQLEMVELGVLLEGSVCMYRLIETVVPKQEGHVYR